MIEGLELTDKGQTWFETMHARLQWAGSSGQLGSDLEQHIPVSQLDRSKRHPIDPQLNEEIQMAWSINSPGGFYDGSGSDIPYSIDTLPAKGRFGKPVADRLIQKGYAVKLD